jgi:hypothetical protein
MYGGTRRKRHRSNHQQPAHAPQFVKGYHWEHAPPNALCISPELLAA